MKKLNFIAVLAILALTTLSGCKEKTVEPNTNDGYGYNFTKVIDDYVDKVVLVTYTDLKNKSWTLYDAVETFKKNKTQNNLDAVCIAWRTTRIPWEQSEGFLFGPAEQLSIDPSLDSWPLDKSQIDAVISNEKLDITFDAIASSNVHGFHTIEYLIFKDGDPRTYTELSDREIDYLAVATEFLRNDCLKLWAAWNGTESIPAKDNKVLEDIEFDPSLYNFAVRFKKAGKAGSTYITQDDAIDQIIDGCVDIASEVGSQKIGGPSASGVVLDVESWYSWNSIEDFSNNIISIRNSYFGGIGKTAENPSANSISAFVKSKNRDLDKEISDAITSAYTAISGGMEHPFRNNLTGDKVKTAIASCATLEKTMEKIKTLRD